MFIAGAKVYSDGSHYIAIPHTTRPAKKRKNPPEEITNINESVKENIAKEGPTTEVAEPSNSIEFERIFGEPLPFEKEPENKPINKKELFEESYKKNIDLSRSQRKNAIIEELKIYFDTQQECEEFVNENIQRKIRNLICRRVRMVRKANLANFNYFCTFTYDSKKHSEQSFKKKLRYCFANFCRRNSWRYMGVWERAPETKRLHFHGLFDIPNNTLPGELVKVKDYDTKSFKMQESVQSSYFNERFGRSDFKEIANHDKELGNELAYLMKYIEKTGEKIVYSKNLPQYFISDILEDDIVCTIGQEDRKLLLFDDFKCLDEGVLMGNVCPEVIKQMKKCN